MKKFIFMMCVLLLSFDSASCGYTTKSTLPARLKSINVERFENKISYTSDSTQRNLYIPLLEVDIQKGIVDRFLFDGNLKIQDADGADLILKGSLINYDRRALRYTDGDDVQEYRIYLSVSLTLVDNETDEVLWEEPNFTGEATYFVTGSLAKSEEAAIDEAVVDLARRIVERTVEDW